MEATTEPTRTIRPVSDGVCGVFECGETADLEVSTPIVPRRRGSWRWTIYRTCFDHAPITVLNQVVRQLGVEES